MKTFDEKVKQIKNKRILLGIFILIIAFITFILGIIEILPRDIGYSEFKKDDKSSKYAKTTVYYLMGPLVRTKATKREGSSAYYIAVGEDNNLFIIRLNEENIEIPILAKNLDENSIDTLEGIEVKGSIQLTSSSLREALNDRLNNILKDKTINSNNFEKILGEFHLDTVSDVENSSAKLFILAIFFTIIGLLYIVINKRIRKNVNITIEELKVKGILDEVISEFNSEKLIDYRKLKVYLSPDYIFSYNMGLCVIPFKDIKEINISKKEIGSYNKNKYIIITTKDNREYYIAPMQNRRQKAIFNELLTKIKTMVE